MANFIGMVYGTLQQKGIDTSKMSTEEAIKKFNELQGKDSGDVNSSKTSSKGENLKSKQNSIKANNEVKTDISQSNKNDNVKETKNFDERIKKLEEELNDKNLRPDEYNEKQQELGMLKAGFDDKEKYKDFVIKNVDDITNKTLKGFENVEEEYKKYNDEVNNKIDKISEIKKTFDKNLLPAQLYIEENSKEMLDSFKNKEIANSKSLLKKTFNNEIMNLKNSKKDKPAFLMNGVNYEVEKFNENSKFEIDEIERNFGYKEDVANQYIGYLEKMKTIAKEKGLKITKSPYSDSFYLLPKDEEITWNYKPDGSYRLSDHWNFWSKGEQHCKTDTKGNGKIKMLKYDKKTDSYIDI